MSNPERKKVRERDIERLNALADLAVNDEVSLFIVKRDQGTKALYIKEFYTKAAALKHLAPEFLKLMAE